MGGTCGGLKLGGRWEGDGTLQRQLNTRVQLRLKNTSTVWLVYGPHRLLQPFDEAACLDGNVASIGRLSAQ